MLRSLLQRPAFTCFAILTLAVGIGGTTAMFTVVHTLLLRPLPFPEPDRIVGLWESNRGKSFPQAPMAAAQFLDLRRTARSFDALAVWNSAAVNLADDGAPPERHAGAQVTEDFFKVLGVFPAVGTGFATNQFQAGADGVVVIGHDVWQQRFQGSADILGRTLRINGRPRTVVGVMPAGFQTPSKAAFWVPKVFKPEELEDRDYKAHTVLGRLAPRVSLAEAQSEVNTLFSGMRRQFPDVLEGWSCEIHPALEDLVKPMRPALLLLLAAVGVVLLMACLNVANLLLARGVERHGELGIRAALGASRRRLALESLGESLILALAGGALGWLFAQGLLGALLRIAPATLPRIEQVRLDPTALLVTAATCLVTTLIAGLAPALHQSQADPMDALRSASPQWTARVGGWRRALVVVQVAASVVVLVTTGLLLRSFERVLHRDLGFNPEHVLTTRLELPPLRYGTDQRRDQFAEDVLARLSVSPGIESAGASTALPLQGWPQLILRLEENPITRPSDAPSSGYTGITPGYLRTLGMRVLRGRDVTHTDREDTPLICLVNESFARTHYGERDPIGRRIEIGFSTPPRWMEIVGVVNDAQNAQLEAAPRDQVFVSFRQQPDVLRENPAISLVVRGRGAPEAVGESLRQAVWSVDRNQPLHLLQPMSRILDGATAPRRFTVLVLGTFAAVALVLAALGLFGVLSGQVASRTRELGVRMALGAQPSDILRQVLAGGMRTLALGMALGISAALAVSRLIQSQLYETAPWDPLSLLLTLFVLVLTGAAACWFPAFRASQVDPMAALRAE
ncbi:MAG: ABC transporter permease [Verrucomicrobiota bacterium]